MKAAGDITSYLLYLHSYEHWDSNLLLRILPFPPPTSHIPIYILFVTKIINSAVSVFM